MKCGSAALSKQRSALKGPKGNYDSKPQLNEEHSTWERTASLTQSALNRI